MISSRGAPQQPCGLAGFPSNQKASLNSWTVTNRLDQAAWGSGGVPIPGGVQKTCGCGTSGHDLAGVVVLGWLLDLVILEVFSNLNDCATL